MLYEVITGEALDVFLRLGVVEGLAHDGVIGVGLGRITSYNVCYTKLLRLSHRRRRTRRAAGWPRRFLDVRPTTREDYGER